MQYAHGQNGIHVYLASIMLTVHDRWIDTHMHIFGQNRTKFDRPHLRRHTNRHAIGKNGIFNHFAFSKVNRQQVHCHDKLLLLCEKGINANINLKLN